MIPKFNRWLQSIRSKFTLVAATFAQLSLILTLLSASAHANPSSDWQIAKQAHGITIYQRPTATGYIQVKAEIEAKGIPQDFLDLLEDVAVAPEWISNCEQVKVLSKPTQHERVVHTLFSAPWPVKDRDMVTHSVTSRLENGDIEISIQDASEQLPETQHHVRMQNVQGNWQIKPLANNKIAIRYIGKGEPAGALPVWLANNLIVSSTFSTFEQLDIQLQQRTSKRLQEGAK